MRKPWPDTSLLQARDKRDAARKLIADGIDPGITRKIEKAGSIENTFKAVAEDFLMTKQNEWSITTIDTLRNVSTGMFTRG